MITCPVTLPTIGVKTKHFEHIIVRSIHGKYGGVSLQISIGKLWSVTVSFDRDPSPLQTFQALRFASLVNEIITLPALHTSLYQTGALQVGLSSCLRQNRHSMTAVGAVEAHGAAHSWLVTPAARH